VKFRIGSCRFPARQILVKVFRSVAGIFFTNAGHIQYAPGEAKITQKLKAVIPIFNPVKKVAAL